MIATTIDVAGIALRFSGDRRAAALIQRRYGAFACPPRDDDAIEIELCLRPPRTGAAAYDVPFEVSSHAGCVLFEGAGLCASVAPDLGSARIRAPLAERPIDAVVRYLLASRLLARGGLLVHASAVRYGGRAWVFPGPSGAGKTTLARELSGDALCDEAVALVPHPGGVRAYSTPYWRARPGSAPVAGLAFPVRASDPSAPPRWRELSPSRAVAHLLPAVGPLLPDATERALSASARVARAVSCAELTLATIDQIRRWLEPRLREATWSSERSARIHPTSSHRVNAP